YGPPGCSPPGLIRPSGCSACLRLLRPGCQPPKSPCGLPDVTTAPNGELRRQDLHLQVQQLVSLRSLHRVAWGGFPCFNSTMEHSDVSRSFPCCGAKKLKYSFSPVVLVFPLRVSLLDFTLATSHSL